MCLVLLLVKDLQMRALLIEQPETPAITYYSRPPWFPYTLPLLVAIGIQQYALFGSGYYADTFRQHINSWGGKGLLPGSAVFAGIIVCPT